MIEIGRICVKLAGRDAGKRCVVVDVLDSNTVMIDGETRRRKCNPQHLEPTEKVLKIKKSASHADVAKEFEKMGLKARETKPKKTQPKPVKQKNKAKKKTEPEAETGKAKAKGPEKKEKPEDSKASPKALEKKTPKTKKGSSEAK